MHEIELGTFKQTFIHILRILIAAGGDVIQQMNERYSSLHTACYHLLIFLQTDIG